MLATILIVVLLLMLVGALPNWSHTRQWGYVPGGLLALGFLVVIILAVAERL